MNRIFIYLTRASLIFTLIIFASNRVHAQDTELILQELQILQKDIKTLEKAVYSQPGTGMSSSGKASNSNDDVLTQHLLKLSDLEEQFKILTNNSEEINFTAITNFTKRYQNIRKSSL